jgi:hypothetical protein
MRWREMTLLGTMLPDSLQGNYRKHDDGFDCDKRNEA